MSAPQLEVIWDAAKAHGNIAKHGVTFAQTATVLLDPLAVTVFDAAHSEHEEPTRREREQYENEPR